MTFDVKFRDRGKVADIKYNDIKFRDRRIVALADMKFDVKFRDRGKVADIKFAVKFCVKIFTGNYVTEGKSQT